MQEIALFYLLHALTSIAVFKRSLKTFLLQQISHLAH